MTLTLTFRAAKKLNIQAIQATDELRHKFMSLLGTVVQGGSMISEYDNRCISELFYSPGGILRNNTPIEVQVKYMHSYYLKKLESDKRDFSASYLR